MVSMLNSPLVWKGGKSWLREEILPLLERIPHTTYAEPFVGAGWVILGKRPQGGEFINDRDLELFNLYRVMQNKSRLDRLCHAVGATPHSRAFYEAWNAEDPNTLNSLQRAVRFVVLNRMTWRGAIVAPRKGGAPGMGIDIDGAAPGRFGAEDELADNTATRLRRMAKRLERVHVENKDFADFMRFLDKPDTLFYLDPPYLGTSGYTNSFRRKDHDRLAQVLATTRGKWVLSINDCPEARALYGAIEGVSIRELQTKRSLQTELERDTARELLVGNIDLLPPDQVHFLENVGV